MKSISSVFLLLFSLSLGAQDWQWAKVFGSEFEGLNNQGEDYLQMEVDDSGNVYICGMTWPECYFDGDTLYTNDTIWGAQVFLAKYDCKRERKWITHFGSLNAQAEPEFFFALNETGTRILIDYSPSTQTYFKDTTLGLRQDLSWQRWLIVYDHLGNRIRINHRRSASSNQVGFITADLKPNGSGFVLMGENRRSAVFPVDTGLTDMLPAAYPLIVHLDSNGLYQKHVVIENEKFFGVWDFEVFDGAYYFSGTLSGLPEKDSLISGAVSIGKTAMYGNGICAKFDSNGNIDWYFKTNGLNNESLGPMAFNEDIDRIAFGGNGDRMVIVEQDSHYVSSNLGDQGMFIVYIDTDGNYISSHSSDQKVDDHIPFAIEFIDNNNVAAFGRFFGSFTLDTFNVQAFDIFDLYIAIHDFDKNTWGRADAINTIMQSPANQIENASDLAVDGNGSIYMLGTFNKGLIFKGDTLDTPSTGPFIGDDGFLMKYGVEECPTPLVDNAQDEVLSVKPVLKVFPNPNRGSFQLSFSEEVEGEVQIFSYDGRLVYHQAYKQSEKIDLDVPLGIYLVSLQTSEGERFGAKVVVE